ncbi:MAG: cytochrome c subunit of cbb3 type cytochrome oxidase [Fibrobacteria bacterium]|jgi:mono/diheme cytochrome c family protein|nr:cytochrome c subunit of cbb3 type cytochrome oxidase [Fibrobacteria bacterium]
MTPRPSSFRILAFALAALSLAACQKKPEEPRVSRQALIDSGRVEFGTCALCHGREGRGERCPPLIYSDFVQGDRARLIRFVLRPEDTVRVNGVLWRHGEMPPLETLADFEVAAVLTYIRSLNDSLIACTPESVEAGTWAACRTRARPAADLAADSILPAEVAAVRATLPPL